MSVDALRETFHVNRIRPQDLANIWTAQTYRKEITKALTQLRELKEWLPLEKMCREPISQGRTPSYSLDRAGYPCLKTRHVNSMIVDDSEPDWVTHICAETNSKFRVTPATILMNRSGAGSIGRCAIYLGTSYPLTNEHLLHIRLSNPYDPCFLTAFLSSWWGERAIEGGITGSTGQLNLANEHLKRVPVPAPREEAQRYIGDKVRLAEQLRDHAKKLRRLVDTRLDEVVPVFDDVPRIVSRVESDVLNLRLDCRPYRSHYRALDAAIRKVPHEPISNLVAIGSGDPVPSAEFSSLGVPLVRIRDIGTSGFWSTDTCVSPEYARRANRYSADTGLVVVGMDGIFRAQFILDVELPLHINQRVAMLKSKGFRPELLAAWLNRKEGQYQLNRWAVKTTVEHTSLEYIGRILVPRIDEDEENKLADLLLWARNADWYVSTMTLSAKKLVEQLIEGRVTEAELAAAYQALEAGDRSPDRAILQTLRRDNHGDQPLFADLDGYYALLDQLDEEAPA